MAIEKALEMNYLRAVAGKHRHASPRLLAQRRRRGKAAFFISNLPGLNNNPFSFVGLPTSKLSNFTVSGDAVVKLAPHRNTENYATGSHIVRFFARITCRCKTG